MKTMLENLKDEYIARKEHLLKAIDELDGTAESGTRKQAYDAGQWLEVNAMQLATLAESIARARAAETETAPKTMDELRG